MTMPATARVPNVFARLLRRTSEMGDMGGAVNVGDEDGVAAGAGVCGECPCVIVVVVE